jgi:hypothetical protein
MTLYPSGWSVFFYGSDRLTKHAFAGPISAYSHKQNNTKHVVTVASKRCEDASNDQLYRDVAGAVLPVADLAVHPVNHLHLASLL